MRGGCVSLWNIDFCVIENHSVATFLKSCPQWSLGFPSNRGHSFQKFSGRVKQMTARSRPLPGMDRKTILISATFVHLRIMEPMVSLTWCLWAYYHCFKTYQRENPGSGTFPWPFTWHHPRVHLQRFLIWDLTLSSLFSIFQRGRMRASNPALEQELLSRTLWFQSSQIRAWSHPKSTWGWVLR